MCEILVEKKNVGRKEKCWPTGAHIKTVSFNKLLEGNG